MDQLLEDYIAYYRARVKRYEGNRTYPNSRASENALLEAISSCDKLEDFQAKEKEGNLAVKNAIALVKDQATAENKHYNELREPVRAGASQEILQSIDKAQTALEVTVIASDAETKWIKRVTIDEFTNAFYDSYLMFLENMEVYRTADVPDEWKAEQLEYLNETVQQLKDAIALMSKNNTEWDPGWTLNTALLWEERHRRKIPLPDPTLRRRIEEYEKMSEG